MPHELINQIPPTDVCELAVCPPAYRRAFAEDAPAYAKPRTRMGEPSPLHQPRVMGVQPRAPWRPTLFQSLTIAMVAEGVLVGLIVELVRAKGWY